MWTKVVATLITFLVAIQPFAWAYAIVTGEVFLALTISVISVGIIFLLCFVEDLRQ